MVLAWCRRNGGMMFRVGAQHLAFRYLPPSGVHAHNGFPDFCVSNIAAEVAAHPLVMILPPSGMVFRMHRRGKNLIRLAIDALRCRRFRNLSHWLLTKSGIVLVATIFQGYAINGTP